MAYKIVDMRVPVSMYKYKSPYKMSPNYLVVHNTANTAAARNEVAYMRRNTNQTSYHVAIDHNEVVQSIPFNRNAWHAGDGNDPNNSGNRKAIGVEICYSMDNGYSGSYSSRHRQAENNATLYIAHVLKQYGWGTDRLRQHWHYTRKDCPHKMRAHGGWNAFKKKVQSHLDALNGKKSSSPAKPKPAPKPTGASYTVRSGDTLWGISKASGVSVSNLKSWNVLKSNTIIVGQKLNLKKTSSKKQPEKLDWNYNKNTGAQWAETIGVWYNGDQPIKKRKGSPQLSAPSTGWMKPGQKLDYREIARSDGHIWLLDRYSAQWVPVKTYNHKTGSVGSDWGTWK